jgi:hypothetical protein
MKRSLLVVSNVHLKEYTFSIASFEYEWHEVFQTQREHAERTRDKDSSAEHGARLGFRFTQTDTRIQAYQTFERLLDTNLKVVRKII